jgi:phosphoribosylformylglycinamidine synthase
MRSGAIAGIQDMGAAGLTSSSCEMAARAGTGIELDLSLVPQREVGMTAYEMLLSESQERMLIVAHAGREREVMDIFRKWDLDAVVIGRVRDTKRMQVIHNGVTVADIPVEALTDEAPKYDRPMKPIEYAEGGQRVESDIDLLKSEDPLLRSIVEKLVETGGDISSLSELGGETRGGFFWAFPPQDVAQNHTESLLKLLASPNIASKKWVYRQYDHMVRTNTAILPGADAAVVRIKETRRALAMTCDGNGRYCAANPREGAKLIVAEAARNVVCVGARPIAITNCLNFASPERPEVMWAFSEVIDGMAEACRVFETPVVSGNVSFYNETEGRGILPTPVIGMVGLLEDVRRVVHPGFKNEGDVIALLGVTNDELLMSEYSVSVAGLTANEIISTGQVPKLDLKLEHAVQETCLQAAESGVLRSAHDCSDGGLAVTLAESCFSSHGHEAIGIDVDLGDALESTVLLFAESPSRIVISFDPAEEDAIRVIAQTNNAPLAILGRVGGKDLRIKAGGVEVISESVAQLESAWRGGLTNKLHPDAMVG